MACKMKLDYGTLTPTYGRTLSSDDWRKTIVWTAFVGRIEWQGVCALGSEDECWQDWALAAMAWTTRESGWDAWSLLEWSGPCELEPEEMAELKAIIADFNSEYSSYLRFESYEELYAERFPEY